jgi:hypothetical protein
MLQFFAEGGFAMVPVLLFGLATVGVAARCAWRPDGGRLKVVAALAVVLLASMLHGMLMNVAAVFSYVSDPARVADAELARTVCVGFMESTRPGALGGGFLVLALALAAVGVSRAAQRERALAAA